MIENYLNQALNLFRALEASDMEIIKMGLLILAAFFTYYKFFREGAHKQRIEFDIDCVDLGIRNSERIIEIGVLAENKGNIEHRFDGIRVGLRGIDENSTLEEMKNNNPRLFFPIDLLERLNSKRASLISKEVPYYFVRPKVKQRFPLVVRIPANVTHIRARATFQYTLGIVGNVKGAFKGAVFSLTDDFKKNDASKSGKGEKSKVDDRGYIEKGITRETDIHTAERAFSFETVDKAKESA
jgi:hypothetical protein